MFGRVQDAWLDAGWKLKHAFGSPALRSENFRTAGPLVDTTCTILGYHGQQYSSMIYVLNVGSDKRYSKSEKHFQRMSLVADSYIIM